MIPNLHSGETYIDRLRVQCVGVDPISARLQISSLLNTRGFPQARIPPAAIVFIRKLRDPLPGVLRLDASGGYLPERWHEALAESFHSLVRNAVRPAVSPVNGSEEAVIFLDRSELLACLAIDQCQGTVAARWWWRALSRGGFISQLVTQLWRDRPEYIPAALEHLSNRKLVVEFVRALGEAEIRDLTQRVARAFGLHALFTLLTVSLVGPADIETPAVASPTRSALREIERGEVTQHALSLGWSPWLDWIDPTQAQQLGPEAERLLGIALMLLHQPAHVRTLRFAREVERWQSQLNSSLPAPKRRRLNMTEVRTRRTPHANTPAQHHVELPPARPEASLHFASSSGESEKLSQSFRDKREEFEDQLHTGEITPVELAVKAASGTFGSTDQDAESLSQAADDVRTANFEASLGPVEASDGVSAVRIETELGGLFYLINLGLYLNLYGDFTTPATPGIELNIWDFVALVGEELVGSDDDPIWPFLAHLAGREPDQAPGERFTPDDSWRIAPEWLTHFSSSEPWRWSASDGRLRLLHPEGFLVLDLPLDLSDPAGQLRAEIEKFESVLPGLLNLELLSAARVNDDSETITRHGSPEVSVWLSRLMPYVRARLRAALEVETEDDVASLVCRRFARVDATDTHVDVFFGLADLPLEIRLAGLDRDPGWVPAAGRFIAFHFD